MHRFKDISNISYEISYPFLKKSQISYPHGFWQLQMFSCDEWNNLPLWYNRKFILLFFKLTCVDLTEKKCRGNTGVRRVTGIIMNNHDCEIWHLSSLHFFFVWDHVQKVSFCILISDRPIKWSSTFEWNIFPLNHYYCW